MSQMSVPKKRIRQKQTPQKAVQPGEYALFKPGKQKTINYTQKDDKRQKRQNKRSNTFLSFQTLL